MSLKTKLVGLCAILVVLSVLLIGGLALRQLESFSTEVGDRSFTAMEDQVSQTLKARLQLDHDRIFTLLAGAETDCRRLASSTFIQDFLSSGHGKNEFVNKLTGNEAIRVVEGIRHVCRNHQLSLESKLLQNLTGAQELLVSRFGGLELGNTAWKWSIKDQATGATQTAELPLFSIKSTGQPLLPNKEPGTITPVVDDINKVTGSLVTVFQRVNPRGDMVRVATNVIGKDGKRAIGTAIMAVDEAGKPNPVLAKVLAGETFSGRAMVVGTWCITAYAPLKDSQGAIVGMLFVGIREQDSEEFVKTITQITFGKSGYPFITDSTGKVIVHPRQELVGKNIVSEMNLPEFKDALSNRRSDRIDRIDYLFDNRKKFVYYTHFAEWDWIICGSGYWDDMVLDSQNGSRNLVTRDMIDLFHSQHVEIDGKPCPIFSQIRFIDEAGMEVVSIRNGTPAERLEDKSQKPWFLAAKNLKPGEVYNSGVVQAENTGQPEIRMAGPVFFDGEFHGLIVFNLDWEGVGANVKRTVYGRSGYAFITNEKGVLVIHPKYKFADGFNLADPKLGTLATIIGDRLLKGKSGFDRYTFEGVDKAVSYTHLTLPTIYSV